MEHHLYHPSAPNGGTARPGRVITGSDSFTSNDFSPARRLPANTEAPTLAASANPGQSFGSAVRLFAFLAASLIVFTMLAKANAELPLKPEISVVPDQSPAAGVSSWRVGEYRVDPLAQYDVTARVLSTHGYSAKREAEVSPIDFALGWGPMADRGLLESLNVSQRNRWYFVRWRNAPVRAEEVIANSANTHLLPANPQVAAQLQAVQPGDIVRLRGYLVEVSANDGWTWTSSTKRTDTGDGSCEVLWVESVEVYSDAPITYAALD
ncbi:MAG TPA: hypothetical protein VF168_12020 [Trueperaceae bacterium]